MGKIRLAALVAALSLALSGCMMKTVDEMYRLPKRSEDDNNLQAAIDGVMSGLEYSAPIQGDNQQTVQMADLNGDGRQEALVFAKGTDDRPLKIFVFTKQDGNYVNTGAIQTAGTTFEQVEYVDIDDAPGLELVVGRQVGNEVLHSLSVYSFGAGQADTILTAGYTRYITADLDNDQRRELVVLRPGGRHRQRGGGDVRLSPGRDGAGYRGGHVRPGGVHETADLRGNVRQRPGGVCRQRLR